MTASAKETFPFTVLVLLVLLPFHSSYDQGKAAMGGADQPQGDMMKLMSRISVRKDNQKNLWLCTEFLHHLS